ncbi:unnamed protein product [Cyclocybe aegerita]|uniref:Uncharacterized protein n=1 Tax=Cyclocybe aegerita TaxID=1973307 RepID=A0A8S0X0W8_CYCAE|nr:unnamed protein product [Cyclocybe aegerita]
MSVPPELSPNPGDSDSELARRPTKRPRLDATSDLSSNPHSDGIVGTTRVVPTNTDDTPPNVPNPATTHQASFDGVMSSTIQSNANKLQVLIQELSKESVYEAKKAVATDLAKLEADRRALQERARTLASDRERLNEERWKAARRTKELDATDAAILRNKLNADELAKEIETSKKALVEEKRSLGDTKQAMDVLLNNLEQQGRLAKKASATTEKMRKRRDEKHRLEVQKLRTKLDEDRKAFEEVKRLEADMRKERLLEEKAKWMEEQNQRFKAAEQQWRCKYEDSMDSSGRVDEPAEL